MAWEATEAERQLIEMIREPRRKNETFELRIEQADGVWDIELAGTVTLLDGRLVHNTARGTGASFDEAWDNMGPVGM